MEFQFGTNWSYYFHYVGISWVRAGNRRSDGLLPESTFVGLYFFGSG
ncbi:hypothetical protein ACNKHU_03440 [Shigella flexneri]